MRRSGSASAARRKQSICIGRPGPAPTPTTPISPWASRWHYAAADDFAQARSLTEELRAKHGKFRENDVALLHARALEGLGEHASALDEYERLADTAVGLEAKVRYGQLLKRLGHETQARSVFEAVLAHAKRFNVKHEEEQAWVSVARKELTQLPSA